MQVQLVTLVTSGEYIMCKQHSKMCAILYGLKLAVTTKNIGFSSVP